MASKKVGQLDEEMMVGLWDWCGELNALHNVGVRVTLAPTKRRGVFLLKAQALTMVDGKPVGVVVQYQEEWPTAMHKTLAGKVLGVTMHLDHLLATDALNQDTPPEAGSMVPNQRPM